MTCHEENVHFSVCVETEDHRKEKVGEVRNEVIREKKFVT
jgi:hypothetical protein